LAIEARIADKPIEVLSYTVSEDATPLDPGSMEGGYGEIRLEGLAYPDDILLKGKEVRFVDTVRGRTSGQIVELSSADELLTVTADSILGLLNSWHDVPPVDGNFNDLVSTWFDVVGIDLPIQFEDGLATEPVAVPGSVDNLWDNMKMFLSAHQIEMSLVGETIIFRRPHKFEAFTEKTIRRGWTMGGGDSARKVEVTYYTNTPFYNEEYYPARLNEEETIMQVNAFEEVEYVIQTMASVFELPTEDIPVVDYVPNAPVSSSQYSVVGNDDLPVPAAQWIDGGGSLRLEKHPTDPLSIVVKLRGAGISHLGPFRIAMSSGASNYYNSLRLVGSGVAVSPEVIEIHTGASQNSTGTDIGITVENPFISSLTQAYNAGIRTAGAYSGQLVSIEGEALDINRRHISGSAVTLDTVSEYLSGTIDSFNAEFSGQSLDEASEFFLTLGEEFAVQAFGNATGARVYYHDAYYRIGQAHFAPGTMDYTATIDTLVADFNEVWEGETLNNFSAEWGDKMLQDLSVMPLRRV